uniref:Uncharacterized protein n=1 Tax=Timema poppense TaxID=170557 RepID=A0A7R9DJA9_TIMPO|nr:unnamed protein product [Timema poppensis]
MMRVLSLREQLLIASSGRVTIRITQGAYRRAQHNSPMTSLVLTDSSQLTADGFEKLPDQIIYPYAEPYDQQKHIGTDGVGANRCRLCRLNRSCSCLGRDLGLDWITASTVSSRLLATSAAASNRLKEGELPG